MALVVALAGSALSEAPWAFSSAVEDARARARLGTSERELAPARRVGVDGKAVLAASRVIPESATFYVDAAPAYAVAADPMSWYLLFPRRHVDDAADADWVLLFGSQPPRLDVRLGRRVRLGQGLIAARVQR
ncbi:MAG TPA: hypothetical protein VGP69_03170 [Gaiellaceae bacterium]|nr:hypothetical protein [Gaiellaceae bacterium]